MFNIGTTVTWFQRPVRDGKITTWRCFWKKKTRGFILRIPVLRVSERWFIRYASSFLSFCTRWSLALFSCYSINPIETVDGESVLRLEIAPPLHCTHIRVFLMETHCQYGKQFSDWWRCKIIKENGALRELNRKVFCFSKEINARRNCFKDPNTFQLPSLVW